jgi:NADPH2:quinone reductase
MQTSMKSVIFNAPGDPDVLVWDKSPMPVIGADDVLIKVAAAGVNRADTLQRRGKYPAPADAGDVLGMEVSGEIVSVGADVRTWKTGDKVAALISGGGYAEYARAPALQCLPIPDGISMIEAAGLMEATVTVWANIFDGDRLKPGNIALIHGGASGIGTTAIQMIKAFGADVFVTASTDERCALCRDLGADLAINYKRDDFVSITLRESEDRGVDVVLDMVGGDYVARNIAALAEDGWHVSIATISGKDVNVDLRAVMMKRLKLTGSTLRHRSAPEKARLVRDVHEKVWPWVKSGKVKPLIYQVFNIKDAADAHKVMESGAHAGKIILEITSA